MHIRKAIDRIIYEITRKHYGNQVEFSGSFPLKTCVLKWVSVPLLKIFRYNIKQLTKANNLSNYSICYDIETNMVILIIGI
ncbi:MAG: replication initiator protein A [Arsenophonus sp. NC-WZS1-MAG3]